MNCSDIPECMPLHLAGELGPDQSAEFELHLQSCAVCAEEARLQAALDDELRAAVLAERVDSRPIEQRVMWEIRAAEVRARNRWRAGFAAAAAIVLVAGSAGAWFVAQRANRPAAVHTTLTPVFQAAAHDHQSEVVERQPRRWRVDAAAIHQLAERESVAAIDLNAVAPTGYRLAQAKFCLLDGRFYLHLVYTDGKGNYSLYLRHEAQEASGVRQIALSDSQGDHVAGFHSGSVTAMVVTDQSGDAAVRFARAASAKIL